MAKHAGNETLTTPPRDGRQAGSSSPTIRWVYPSVGSSDLALHPGGVALGRGDTCEIRLLGAEISRHHAEIRRLGPVWVLRDLSSRNGTFLNGRAVKEAPLSPNDVMRVGEWLGVITGASDAPQDFSCLAPDLFGGAKLASTLALARKAAGSELPVIVEGETGTGKERVARAIHDWSGRPGGFFAINCGAIVESLAESELFGHRKGAFTGAGESSAGLLRAASRGTLLLDEVVDLPMALQGKLLRVLEQKEVQPVGEPRPVAIDVRFIAAAQIPLRTAVKAGRFRPDLLARLEGVTLRIPPLREREGDVVPLFRHFLRRFSENQTLDIDARFAEQLCLSSWPLNVRETELLARRLVVLFADEDRLTVEHLQRVVPPPAPASVPASTASPTADTDSASALLKFQPDSHRQRSRDEQVRSLVSALESHKGNLTGAARELGITRQRAYRLLKSAERRQQPDDHSDS